MKRYHSHCHILATQVVQQPLLLNYVKPVKRDRASEAFCLQTIIGKTASFCVTQTQIK